MLGELDFGEGAVTGPASKSATALFLSCVFLVIVGTVLRSFFL